MYSRCHIVTLTEIPNDYEQQIFTPMEETKFAPHKKNFFIVQKGQNSSQGKE